MICIRQGVYLGLSLLLQNSLGFNVKAAYITIVSQAII